MKRRDPAIEQAIAEHIARHGVSRCPVAAVAETTAVIPVADLNAIAAHAAELDGLKAAYLPGALSKLTPAQRAVRIKMVSAYKKARAARKGPKIG